MSGVLESENSFITGGSPEGDLFVAKYDPTGNQVWMRRYGGAGADEGDAIILDSSGNLYVAGSLNKYNQVVEGPIDFGGVNLLTAGNAEVVITKLDANGDVVWAMTTGGSANDYAHGIAGVMSECGGVLYVRASVGMPAWGQPTAGTGSQDVLIKVGPSSGDSAIIWAQEMGNEPHVYGGAVAVDAAGNSYVTGSFQGAGTFGATTLASNGGLDIYLAKYDSNGNLIWAQQIGGAGDDQGFAVAVDSEGNTLLTGYFAGTVSVDGISLSSQGQREMFVAKFDHNGSAQWAKQAGGSGSVVIGQAIAADGSGNCYLTGYFSPQDSSTAIVSVTFDNVTLTTRSGGPDAFVAKYDSEGNLLWVRQAGGDMGDQGAGIAVDGLGNVYVTGSFYRSAIFDAVTITGDEYDLFIAKYDADGNNLWAKAGGLPHSPCCDSRGFAIAVDGSGNSYVTGVGSDGGLRVDKYDTVGNRLWLKQYGGPQVGQGDAITLDSLGNIYLVGRLNIYNPLPTSISFGGICLPIAGYADVVIARIDESGNVVTAMTIGGAGNEFARGIALDGFGNIYVHTSVGVPWGNPVTGIGSHDVLMKLGQENSAPVVSIASPASGAVFAVGTPVNFAGSFTDNSGDTHTALWTFDAIVESGFINESSGEVNATHTFTEPGVYFVTLVVTDSSGNSGTANTVEGLTALIVIYDPDGGFVTGGGWINSPPGAYTSVPSLTGKANFGFVSKYLKGANVPTGNTEFQFRAGGLNFSSTSYQWLVVAGAKAQYKGVGKVNGAGSFGFVLTAIDGQINGGGGLDKFRIKIWDKSNNDSIVYDNQLGDSDGADPSTALGGGSIVIHKK